MLADFITEIKGAILKCLIMVPYPRRKVPLL